MTGGELLETAPVLALTAAAAAALVAGGTSRRAASIAGVVGILVAAAALLLAWRDDASRQVLGVLRFDRHAALLGLVVLGAAGAVLVLHRDDRILRRGPGPLERRRTADVTALTLFAALGAVAAAAAEDLAAAAVALQLEALAATVLVGIDRRGDAVEAAIKHALAAVIAAALMLFGAAAVHAGCGSSGFAPMAQAIAGGDELVLLGAGFFLAGLFVRLAAVPFHFWQPDVWQGARAPALLLLGVIGPTAALAVGLRLLAELYGDGESAAFRDLCWWLAAMSMVAGSLAVLVQGRLRRLLAHGAIANVGCMLCALTVFGLDGDRGAGVGMSTFLVAQALSLGAIVAATTPAESVLGRALEWDELPTWRPGSRLPALSLAVGIAGFVGLPGTAGFIGRVTIFEGTMRASLASGDESFMLLAILGIVTALTVLYVHLRVLVRIFAGSPGSPAAVARPSTILAASCAAGVLWLGVGPPVIGIGADELLAWAAAACETLR